MVVFRYHNRNVYQSSPHPLDGQSELGLYGHHHTTHNTHTHTHTHTHAHARTHALTLTYSETAYILWLGHEYYNHSWKD